MRTVDLVEGGPGGPYGGLSVYCPDAKMGVGYSDLEDRDVMIAHVLDMAERVLGEPLVAGNITNYELPQRAELISDDERIEVAPKQKKKKQPYKPHYQNQEWYGGKPDQEHWGRPLDLDN